MTLWYGPRHIDCYGGSFSWYTDLSVLSIQWESRALPDKKWPVSCFVLEESHHVAQSALNLVSALNSWCSCFTSSKLGIQVCTTTPGLAWVPQPELSTWAHSLFHGRDLPFRTPPTLQWPLPWGLLVGNTSSSTSRWLHQFHLQHRPRHTWRCSGNYWQFFICLFCFFKVNMVFPFDWSLVCLPDIPKWLTVRNQYLTFFK